MRPGLSVPQTGGRWAGPAKQREKPPEPGGDSGGCGGCQPKGEPFRTGPGRHWEVTRRPPQRQTQEGAPRVRFREEEGTEGFRDVPSVPTMYGGY